METTTQFKARCLVRDLGRVNAIRYAENIGNREYTIASEYIKEHTDANILSYQGYN